jgi:hypothetical protein
MILLPGKGWPGMALGQMRGAALAAALVIVTCQRARHCPRVLAVCTRPSRHGLELAGLSRPAAERAAGQRPPASARPGAAAVMTISRFAAEPMLREIPLSMPRAPEGGLLMRAQWT